MSLKNKGELQSLLQTTTEALSHSTAQKCNICKSYGEKSKNFGNEKRRTIMPQHSQRETILDVLC